MNTQFTIRREKPKASDKYAKCYIQESTGGWNASIFGYPQDAECNVLSNCVGYASGRFSEIYDEITGKDGCHYKYFNGNPSTVPDRVKEFYPWLTFDKNPQIGDMIAWSDHVAVIEDVISENELLISDSAYRGDAFRIYTINNDNGNWGRSELLGFVHQHVIHEENPVIDPVECNSKVDQIEATIDNYCNVRSKPYIQGPKVGTLKLGYYDVLDTTTASGYTWYKIADYQWVAGTIHITFHKAIEDIPEPVVEEPIDEPVIEEPIEEDISEPIAEEETIEEPVIEEPTEEPTEDNPNNTGFEIADKVRLNISGIISLIFSQFRIENIDNGLVSIKSQANDTKLIIPYYNLTKITK